MLVIVTVLARLCPRDSGWGTAASGLVDVGEDDGDTGVRSAESSAGTGLRTARRAPGPPPEDVRFTGGGTKPMS